MKIAIVGFSGCGKSTCFKSITLQNKVVPVPDERLEKLKSIFHPKKITPAEIAFEDLPGFDPALIKKAEALAIVAGIFSGRDPVKDIDSIRTEFMVMDLEMIERRFPEAEDAMEKEALLKSRGCLEQSRPLSALALTADEEKAIRGFRFLSRKPFFVIGNISESQREGEPGKAMAKYAGEECFSCVEYCGILGGEDRNKVIMLAYKTLGHITFFTVKGNETKAWAVRDGIQALEAAGKIHSDIQKGFIKAEVISFDDLMSAGSKEEARKKGLLKLQAKEYKIRDGDIIDFRFSK